MKTKIIIGTALDVYLNLAYEEHLVESAQADEVILFLWQNADTVVIGCNQNPWRECNLNAMEREHVKLSRRVTGGGAVFHDMGNMNFSFIVPKAAYDVARQGKVIVDALAKIGLTAMQSGRNDITVQDKKFSGNAFLHRKDTSLHHGTILIGADMSRLGAYLNVNPLKLAGKGIQSVRARVVNLNEYVPELTVKQMMDLLTESFSNEYGTPESIVFEDLSDLPERVKLLGERNASWEWLLGKTPQFTMDIQARFPWGSLEIGFVTKGGRVEVASVFSDSLIPDFVPKIAAALAGKAFTGAAMAESVRMMRTTEEEAAMQADVSEWLDAYEF